ncbi:hypothetical protein J2T16_003455 [Paenibacillus intestini]|nr:hypothetical protein [Paenibacillus intestini]
MNGSSRTAKALRELRGGATQWLESFESRPGTELWKHEKRQSLLVTKRDGVNSCVLSNG